MMRSTLSTFTKHTIGRVLRRTSTKQRSITLVVRSLRHRCRGKAKNDSNSGKSCSSRRTTAPHAVSHQHLYPLASRWTPHPQAHSIQEQVSIVIAQLGLVKLANRLVQIAGQFRDRLRAHHFAGQGGHYPPHLPRADPAQKCLPDQQRDLLRPPLKRLQTTGQKTLLASTRNPQPDGAEAGHKIPLVVAVAIDSPSATPPFVPPPARIAIALPLRLQLEKPLPG